MYTYRSAYSKSRVAQYWCELNVIWYCRKFLFSLILSSYTLIFSYKSMCIFWHSICNNVFFLLIFFCTFCCFSYNNRLFCFFRYNGRLLAQLSDSTFGEYLCVLIFILEISTFFLPTTSTIYHLRRAQLFCWCLNNWKSGKGWKGQ